MTKPMTLGSLMKLIAEKAQAPKKYTSEDWSWASHNAWMRGDYQFYTHEGNEYSWSNVRPWHQWLRTKTPRDNKTLPKCSVHFYPKYKPEEMPFLSSDDEQPSNLGSYSPFSPIASANHSEWLDTAVARQQWVEDYLNLPANWLDSLLC